MKTAPAPPPEVEGQTVGAYLGDWLDHMRGRVRPKTHDGYHSLIRLYALPALGSYRLLDLSPLDIQRLYGELFGPKRGLSGGTVVNLHLVLTQAFGQAERWGLIARNPAAGAQPPRPRRPERTYDDASRRETMTVAGQPAVSFTYFNNDLLDDIVRSTETVSIAYDQANRLDSVTLPDAVVQDFTLNAAGDTTQVAYPGGQGLGGISYSYDGMGRRHGVWDTQGRVALPAATTSNAVYDGANRLTSWNGGTLTYDMAGNLTQNGAQTYTWNARGQLTATSAGSATFAYDAFGRRSSAAISGDDSRIRVRRVECRAGEGRIRSCLGQLALRVEFG